MAEHETTLSDHSELSRKLLDVLEGFIDEIGDRRCTTHLDAVLTNDHYLKGKNLGQKPERFIEDNLIFPMLRVLGHDVRPRPIQYAPRWSHGRGIPDFALTTISPETVKQNHLRLFGESKPPNKLGYAREDMEAYLSKDLDFHAIAILTDGIDWEMWIRPRKETLSTEYQPYALASLREALLTVKNKNLSMTYSKHDVRSQIDVGEFEDFTADGMRRLLHTEFGLTNLSD